MEFAVNIQRPPKKFRFCAIVVGPPPPPLIPFTPYLIKNATSLKVQNSFKAAFKSLFQHKGNSVVINHKGAKTHFKVFFY